MSYKLMDVIEELDGAGLIITDASLVEVTLGLNPHQDLVITSEEIKLLKNALTALQVLALSEADEFLENLAEKALDTISGDE